MITFHAGSAEETADLGRRLGLLLQKGDTVCLNGDLGTGKTAFTGGIAAALGIEGHITSPTFTIVNEYEGKLPLYHFDVYRIGDADEMFETGYDEYVSGNGVTVIEWAERIREILPTDRTEILLEKDNPDKPDSRLVTMQFYGRAAEYGRRLSHEGACD